MNLKKKIGYTILTLVLYVSLFYGLWWIDRYMRPMIAREILLMPLTICLFICLYIWFFKPPQE